MPTEEPYTRVTDAMLSNHIEHEEKKFDDIDGRLDTLETELAAIKKGVTDILDAYSQAKGALTFIKILAGIAAALSSVYIFVTSNFSITPK
jgi:hypothetical protein